MGEIQEFKQINPLHASHVVALSQACPSNANAIFTPLDLCDAVPPNSDALSIGYPGSHTSGLALPNNHGSVGPGLPTSNVNSRLPGSPGMVLGGNLPSPSSLNAPSRDAQRSLQQSGLSVPGVLPSGVDRGVRRMGMMPGLNRGTHGTRPGFPRLGSPGMLNMVSSGNLPPSNGQGLQNNVTVHPGAIPGPGNAMLRPRDPMQMLRPGQSSEEHRQMMMPDFQLQVSQGNSQAVHFNGPPFSSAGASSPVQSFPVQQSQPHQIPQQSHMFGNTHLSHIQGANQTNSQQPGYAMRLAKERQIQQMIPQQQRPLSGPSAVPAVQNGSQMQQQGQGSASGVIPSQQQLKQQHPAQNSLGSSVLPNQAAATTSHKQKKQQGQQQSRQNQQQRNQGSQQAKLMKSLGRGNLIQNPDATQASGISTACKSQAPDKNVMQQSTGYLPGNRGPLPSISQPGNQPKIYASQVPQSPVQTPDVSNQQGSVKGSPSQGLLASQQSPLHSSSQLATQQQQQQQRYMNPSQNNIQRLMMQQNRHMNTDGRIELPADQVQHNQAMPSASLARSTDSGSPGISSINQRKQESSHDPAAVTSTSQLANSPHDTFVGSDTLLSTSSQMLQRQLSGGVPIHGHGIGGQMQQQQSRQQLQSQQQQRPVVQGSVYAHPSNSGPG
ncbi:hypothetical protein QOZ80_1AG0021830 [Eleusine coracana subsp. coracana]|nr:hypothetical protein QOZ80_1AG0021830 [Eleusine coracana subsp. coracana]